MNRTPRIHPRIAASAPSACLLMGPATAGAYSAPPPAGADANNGSSLMSRCRSPYNPRQSSTTTPASGDQATGPVLIMTTIAYGSATAAGARMVTGQDGVTVTNHHGVASAPVTVTVPVSGTTCAVSDKHGTTPKLTQTVIA